MIDSLTLDGLVRRLEVFALTTLNLFGIRRILKKGQLELRLTGHDTTFIDSLVDDLTQFARKESRYLNRYDEHVFGGSFGIETNGDFIARTERMTQLVGGVPKDYAKGGEIGGEDWEFAAGLVQEDIVREIEGKKRCPAYKRTYAALKNLYDALLTRLEVTVQLFRDHINNLYDMWSKYQKNHPPEKTENATTERYIPWEKKRWMEQLSDYSRIFICQLKPLIRFLRTYDPSSLHLIYQAKMLAKPEHILEPAYELWL